MRIKAINIFTDLEIENSSRKIVWLRFYRNKVLELNVTSEGENKYLIIDILIES